MTFKATSPDLRLLWTANLPRVSRDRNPPAQRRKPPPAMTHYGYARVSTGDQNPGAQQTKLRADGCAPENIYTDHGASGARARRPKWDELRRELRPGDTLVCVKLDRIGRSVANLVEVVGWLADNDITLRVLDQSIDTSTPAGRLLFHVLAAIAEFERDLIIERTTDGQAEVRRAGNLRRSLGGPPPLGLRDPGPDGDDSRDWIADPAAAAMLARVAAAIVPPAAEPLAAAFAAEQATWAEPMTDATGREVNEKMVRAALKRPATAGLLTADDAEPLIPGPPLALAAWRKTRAVFDARRRPGRVTSDKDPYFLGPLLRCGKCGNQLSGGIQTGEPYYRCANPHKSLGITRACRGVSIRAADVNEMVQVAVQAWASGSKHAAAAARLQSQVGTERARVGSELDDWREQMDDLIESRRWASRQQWVKSRDQIAAEITRLEDELTALDLAEADPLPAVLDWDAMPGTERRRWAAEVLVTPITVAPGRGGPNPMPAAERVVLEPYSEGASDDRAARGRELAG